MLGLSPSAAATTACSAGPPGEVVDPGRRREMQASRWRRTRPRPAVGSFSSDQGGPLLGQAFGGCEGEDPRHQVCDRSEQQRHETTDPHGDVSGWSVNSALYRPPIRASVERRGSHWPTSWAGRQGERRWRWTASRVSFTSWIRLQIRVAPAMISETPTAAVMIMTRAPDRRSGQIRGGRGSQPASGRRRWFGLDA
jgi:hypothetical protein